MLRFLKSFFGKPAEPAPLAPYKVETPSFPVGTPPDVPADPAPIITTVVPSKPEPAKCGCGRSSTGYCVGLHKLTAEEWAVHPDNKDKPAAKKPAAKKPAAKKAPAKKPAAITAAKKPRAKKEAK